MHFYILKQKIACTIWKIWAHTFSLFIFLENLAYPNILQETICLYFLSSSFTNLFK